MPSRGKKTMDDMYIVRQQQRQRQEVHGVLPHAAPVIVQSTSLHALGAAPQPPQPPAPPDTAAGHNAMQFHHHYFHVHHMRSSDGCVACEDLKKDDVTAGKSCWAMKVLGDDVIGTARHRRQHLHRFVFPASAATPQPIQFKRGACGGGDIIEGCKDNS